MSRLRSVVRAAAGRLAAAPHPLWGSRPGGDPVLREVERAMRHIREHYGEARAKRRRQFDRDVQVVGRGEASARERAIRSETAVAEGISVGDVFTLGDVAEWHVVEARKAGAGRYVLVVER
jgi:hypothetical protein